MGEQHSHCSCGLMRAPHSTTMSLLHMFSGGSPLVRGVNQIHVPHQVALALMVLVLVLVIARAYRVVRVAKGNVFSPWMAMAKILAQTVRVDASLIVMQATALVDSLSAMGLVRTLVTMEASSTHPCGRSMHPRHLNSNMHTCRLLVALKRYHL